MELAQVCPSAAPVTAVAPPAPPSQLLTIDPKTYTDLVFAPFVDRLTAAKEAAPATVDVSTSAGMAVAVKHRAIFREIRVESEKERKARKAPILEIGRLLDSRQRALEAEIAPLESRFDDAIKAEEARKEADRKAREDAERARVQAIQAKLAKLQAIPEVYTADIVPARLAEVIQQLEAGLTFDYQEFAEAAECARQRAITALREAQVSALERVEREAAAEAARAAEAAAEAARLAEERQREEAERQREEARLKADREAEEARLEAKRQAFKAAQLEAARVANIRLQIDSFRAPATLTATSGSGVIGEQIMALRAREIHDGFAEFKSEAEAVKAAELTRLESLQAAALDYEAEQTKLRAEREELARQQAAQAEREAEQAGRQAELDRHAREQAETDERRNEEDRRRAEQQAEERAQQEAAEAKRRSRRARAHALDAESIADVVAEGFDIEPAQAAARIAEIPASEWGALAADTEAAA